MYYVFVHNKQLRQTINKIKNKNKNFHNIVLLKTHIAIDNLLSFKRPIISFKTSFKVNVSCECLMWELLEIESHANIFASYFFIYYFFLSDKLFMVSK